MRPIRPAMIASLLFLMTLGAPAQQYPASPSAPPGPPQPSQPSQQPSPQPQVSQPAQRPPTIDEQVKVLAQELNLNDDQQIKSRSILQDQRQQAAAVIGDNTLSRDNKIQKIRGIRENTIARVRGILNDDQKKKFDQMLQEPAPQPPAKEPLQ